MADTARTGFAGLAALGADLGDALAPLPTSPPGNATATTAGPAGAAAPGAAASGTAPSSAAGPYQGPRSKQGGRGRATAGMIVAALVVAAIVVSILVTREGSGESMPPVGATHTYARTEVRWCVAEDMRLQGARDAVSRAKGDDVRRFNDMVDDYNSRCARFRYRSGDLDGVRGELAPARDRLRADGAARFAR